MGCSPLGSGRIIPNRGAGLVPATASPRRSPAIPASPGTEGLWRSRDTTGPMRGHLVCSAHTTTTRPTLQTLYRLCQSLRVAGRTGELPEFDQRSRLLRSAREQALPLYKEANAVSTLGTAPHSGLYHRLADLRERMGRPDEAMAWHKLVLIDQGDDPVSRSALARLVARDTGATPASAAVRGSLTRACNSRHDRQQMSRNEINQEMTPC